ncbi:LytTR family DNA-binding domain-containing protein [Roseateles sp.]|uniref:LytR/AlgR family response regulator transcription factor n=1 Tax=Roseateles sp. TaxID=1971397 RepID=UPI0025D26DC6|nr:LytTR family DNA-binding domain-containing protein [Roseateles sp.]MBV8034208.1 response regulator transcription factor [Roseateles sp.]
MDHAKPPTAVIAEDEPLLADELRRSLAALWPQLRIAAQACDGAQALLAIDEHRPDVAFLDIRMPVLSGLDVAQRVAGRCHVAFLSAYDQHAIAAFEAGGVDYVLKPLSPARLAVTVERLKSRITATPAALERALQQLAAQAPTGPRAHLQWINASHGRAVQIITVDEVLYFRADTKCTLVVTAQGEAVIRKTLKELGDELDPTSFWQVHRSAIVNVHAIDHVRRDGRGNMQLRLKGRAETLPVSTQYQSLFRQM